MAALPRSARKTCLRDIRSGGLRGLTMGSARCGPSFTVCGFPGIPPPVERRHAKTRMCTAAWTVRSMASITVARKTPRPVPSQSANITADHPRTDTRNARRMHVVHLPYLASINLPSRWATCFTACPTSRTQGHGCRVPADFRVFSADRPDGNRYNRSGAMGCGDTLRRRCPCPGTTRRCAKRTGGYRLQYRRAPTSPGASAPRRSITVPLSRTRPQSAAAGMSR